MNKIFKLTFFLSILILIVYISVYGIKLLFNYKSLSITNFDIQALVEKNGDMKIDMINEYLFKGKYNGIYITIPYDINDLELPSINDSVLSDNLYNNTGVKDFKVYLNINGIDTELKEVDTATLGDRYVYTKQIENGYVTYKIYEPSLDESKTFKISFTLVNAAINHIDVGEIYWNFIGGNYECNIDNLNIDLSFESPSEIKYAYIHGKQGGKLTINNDNLNIKYTDISPHQFVALRAIFDYNSIIDSNKFSNIEATPIILEQEKILQDKINKKLAINNILICIIVLLVIYYIYLLVKYEYDKLFIVYCDDEYKILDKYNPMILACIAQNREMNSRDIISVLLDLINKKILKLEVHNTLTKKRYIIKKTNNITEIDEIQKNVIDLFFDNVTQIDLESKVKELNKSNRIIIRNKTITKIKRIDKLAIKKLNELGANTVKINKSLLTFNNILFVIICIIILLNVAFNISSNSLTLSESNINSIVNTIGLFIKIILVLLIFLPIILYLIYIILYIFRNTQKYIGKFAFKFSGKKLIVKIITFCILSSVVFTLLFLTVQSQYIIIDTILFMISLLIIMTDNLMSKHDIKIYKTFLILKKIENKLKTGSLLSEKKIDDLLIWEKYLTFAIALGITDVSKYTEGLDIQEDINGFLLQTNAFISYYYNINNFERDIITSEYLKSFNNTISSFSNSYYSSFGSGFGSGGFSGGGGNGGRWRWILINSIFKNLYIK